MRVGFVICVCTAWVLLAGGASGMPRTVLLREDVTSSEPDIEVLSSGGNGLTVRLDLPLLEVEEFEIDGRIFSLVGIPGAVLHGEVGRPALPALNRLIAVPDRAGVTLRVLSVERERFEGYDVLPMQPDSETTVGEFEIDETYYAMEPLEETPLAEIGEPAILRDLRVVPLTFRPVRYAPTEHALDVARSVTVEIEFAGENLQNAKEASREIIPTSFHRMYQALVLNYAGPRSGQRVGRGKYLIICPNDAVAVSNLQPLVEWRTRMGYEVELATTADTGGSSTTAIKNYIQGVYDGGDVPLEYVCLVGDAAGASLLLPTFHDPYYGGEGDHEYSQLEGGDLLADVHLGRMSVGTTDKLAYVVDKIVNYETNPYMADTEWFKSASLIGDPTSSGITCVHVMQWMKQRLLELGYIDIDEWYAANAVTFFSNSINDGAGIFAYRGFYGMSGIDNSDIDALDNGQMLPFAAFLTCGVGSFEAETSRSEKFFRIGTLGNTRGAIGCIATATLNTHTRYNNVMMFGIWESVLYEGIPELGAALTRGKLALYLQFYEEDPAYAIAFSYWNNLIGDPATRCWTEVPAGEPSVTNPGMIPVGTTSVSVTVEDPGTGQPIEGACVCLWKDGETHVSGFTDVNGEVELGVDAHTTGTMHLTVTEWNRIPFLRDITVSDVADHVALHGYQVDDDGTGSSSGNGDGAANPTETVEIPVELKNWGSATATNVTAVMSSDDPYVTLSDDSENFGSIAPDATVWSADDFDAVIDGGCPHGYAIPLAVDITSDQGDWHALLELPVVSVEFDYGSHTWYDVGGQLDPGESGEVSIAVTNGGGMGGSGVTGTLISQSQHLSVTDPDGSYGFIGQGATVENTDDRFGVSASPAAYPGHVAACLLVLEAAAGARDTVVVGLTIGTASSTDPAGPDGYGYYAFDNTDAEYPDAPIYNWVEIAGNYGGSGTDAGLNDNGFEQDSHVVVSLPFDFVYYGAAFSEVTICSNGWMAMGDQNNSECWNTVIPGAGGPNAMIAPFWDDLWQPTGGEVWTYHDAADHRFIVEWSRLRNQNGNHTQVFEAILYDPVHHPTATGDGGIIFQYHTVSNDDCSEWHCQPYATVGIENLDHSDGLLYSFWNNYPGGAAPLAAGRAIRFVPVVPREAGYLAGRVTNLTMGGTPVDGVEVRLLETGRALFTTIDGSYFGTIPVDTVTLVATHSSFTPDTSFSVGITKDDTTTVDFGLYDILGPDITNTTRQPLTNDTAGPYPIYTTIHDYSGIAEMAFYYRVDLGPFLPLSLAPQGGDDYVAEIPGQPYNSRVDYYLYGKDVPGYESSDPPGAPGDTTYTFYVVPIVTAFEDDMESAGGWSVSGTATTGGWERVDPNATWYDTEMVQPEDDHTAAPGTQCYVTGQSAVGAGQGDADVDNGYTRLLSPVIDLSGYQTATFSYHRWYTNDTGYAPGEDDWQVHVTDDGSNWEILELTNESNRTWSYMEFNLAEYIDLTDQVQIRYTAEDAGSGSIVEAGVDDVLIVAYAIPQDTEAPTVSVVDPNGGEQIVGGEPTPYTIRWNAEDNIGIAATKILLSTDGGNTYPDTLAAGPYDSTYAWAVPYVEEAACRVKVVCYDGASNEAEDISDADFEIVWGTATDLASSTLPLDVTLEQNRPNPFNPVTEIRFGLPARAEVTLRVYSVEGRLVRTLASGVFEAGYHTAAWIGRDANGAEAASGIYFYRLDTPRKVLTKKMILLK